MNTRNTRSQHSQGNRSPFGNGSQRTFSSNGYDRSQSERMRLKGEMRDARQELARVDIQITDLCISKQQLDAAIAAHQQAIPGVALMEIGRFASKAIGFPFLPPAYRNWYYKNERLCEIKQNLIYQEARLFNRREAINLRIQDLQTDLDLLQTYPDHF